jgi:hypothetical protein
MDEIEAYLDRGIQTYEDPADSEYQQGYEAALIEVRAEVERIKKGNTK